MPKWDKSANAALLKFPNKRLRSYAIADYVERAGYDGVVVFTCGNAARELRERFAFGSKKPVLEVGPRGELSTNKWWTPAEIHKAWPNLFDATSGHLPFPLMVKVAENFRNYFSGDRVLTGAQYVPTGSGETIVCLRMAFPDLPLCAVYDNANTATTRDPEAPLNTLVDAWFPVEYWNGVLDV